MRILYCVKKQTAIVTRKIGSPVNIPHHTLHGDPPRTSPQRENKTLP